jgi:hypothetical protein
MKKQSKRSKTKYPALKPELNLRSRYDIIDYDYVDKLSEKDKAWLNKFTEEDVNASLDRKDLSNNIHKTIEQKKDIDRRNNTRKNDAYTRSKAGFNLDYIEDLSEETSVDTEDKIIDRIDAKKN